KFIARIPASISRTQCTENEPSHPRPPHHYDLSIRGRLLRRDAPPPPPPPQRAKAIATENSQTPNTHHKVPPKVPPKPAHLKSSSTCVSPPPFVSVTSSDTNSIGHSLSNGSVASNVSSEVDNRSYSDKENAAAAATIIQADKPKAITEQEPVRVRSQPKEKMTDAQVLEELRQIVNQGDPLQKYEIKRQIGL
ncbi:hypothetical protein OSTOST_23984, partial [Ostertagia ostertagi]